MSASTQRHRPTIRHESTPVPALDWNQLIETALTSPGSVGNFYNRFRTYSFLNQMLLLSQGVLEPVASYATWQTLGRQVLKGSKAYTIIRPIIIEKKDAAGQVEDKLLKFKPVRGAFSLSQTEGDELPEVELPGWDLQTAHERLDIKQVPFAHLDGNVGGYSSGREYAINPVAPFPTMTRFHEVGHIVLGHTAEGQEAEYALHRGVHEFQAQATAHLATNELGVATEEEASHTRGYVQHWMRGERPSEVAIRQVFTATDLILKAGRPAMEITA